MFTGKRILITGGTGSWGQQLTKSLLEHGPEMIRIFSRNEFSQVMMQRTFADAQNIQYQIGDVRDDGAVEEACQGIDYVFHLAALKHVPVCEAQPLEALKTNVAGTVNVIRASIRQKVKKVIDVSTDKAVDPVNFYGMTKAMGEKLMIRANDMSPDTRVVCIRGGNVLGTNGSVVPFFRKRVLEGKSIPLTSQEMTRFFLTLPEAIRLLLTAAKIAVGGETIVMKMNACRIVDIAEVLRRELAEEPVEVREVGIRPGEKLHEVLVSEFEAKNTYCYTDRYYVILPPDASRELREAYHGLSKFPFTNYCSNTFLMAPEEVRTMLKEGGFLA